MLSRVNREPRTRWWPLKRPFVLRGSPSGNFLSSEAVQGTSLAFQGVDDVHGGHGLPLGVLGVGDGITDDVLQKYLQHTAGLLVDQTRDTFHTTTASQTADGGLGDTLDIITQHFSVTFGAPFAESFSSFTTSRHVVLFCK